MRSIYVLLIVALLSSSCKKSERTLIGAWQSYKIEYYNTDGSPMINDGKEVDRVTDNDKYTYIFHSDGSVQIDDITGSFEVHESDIIISIDNQTHRGIYDISGAEMKIIYDNYMSIDNLRCVIYLTSK